MSDLYRDRWHSFKVMVFNIMWYPWVSWYFSSNNTHFGYKVQSWRGIFSRSQLLICYYYRTTHQDSSIHFSIYLILAIIIYIILGYVFDFKIKKSLYFHFCLKINVFVSNKSNLTSRWKIKVYLKEEEEKWNIEKGDCIFYVVKFLEKVLFFSFQVMD